MHVVRRQRLLKIGAVLAVLAIAASLILYALRQNINLFYSPTDIKAGKVPENKMIRLGGMVLPGSVKHQEDLDVTFKITDFKAKIPVEYHGVLPDLFNEGKGVVVEGTWHADHAFKAVTVLAKHDENYMPPDVKAMLAKQGKENDPA